MIYRFYQFNLWLKWAEKILRYPPVCWCCNNCNFSLKSSVWSCSRTHSWRPNCCTKSSYIRPQSHVSGICWCSERNWKEVKLLPDRVGERWVNDPNIPPPPPPAPSNRKKKTDKFWQIKVLEIIVSIRDYWYNKICQELLTFFLAANQAFWALSFLTLPWRV